MKVLVVDNYDSFVYNLVYLLRLCPQVTQLDVLRNDEIELDKVKEYDKILLSPGPGIPSEAGLMTEVIRRYSKEKSILGVCLGHQGIGEVFGGVLENLSSVYHGLALRTEVTMSDQLFENVPESFISARYHSWVISRSKALNDLDILAKDDSNNIMAVKHKKYNVRGIQFHPESILTEHGPAIIQNWLKC